MPAAHCEIVYEIPAHRYPEALPKPTSPLDVPSGGST